MNEPPGARMRVALTRQLRNASWCRRSRTMLLFIDNIFRFHSSRFWGFLPFLVVLCHQPLVTNLHLLLNGSIAERIHQLKRFCYTKVKSHLRSSRWLYWPSASYSIWIQQPALNVSWKHKWVFTQPLTRWHQLVPFHLKLLVKEHYAVATEVQH